MNQLLQRFEKVLQGLGTVGAALVLGGAVLSKTFYWVDGGYRAVIFDRFKGIRQEIKGEGMHVIIPGIQWPIFYEVRTQPKVITTKTGTKDLQTVAIDLRILYKPDIEYLPSIYDQLGLDYDERILPSIGNEILKQIVAQYNAEQLLTQREKVSAEIRQQLTQRGAEFHIIMEDVSIIHLQFGKEFSSAIEQKQVAQQEAEMKKFLVMKHEEEKKAAVIRAEGEAEAAELISSAMQTHGTGLLEIRRIEAAKYIAETLSKSPNISYLPSGQTGMLINVPMH